MPRRILFFAAAILSCLQCPVAADQEWLTPDQIVARYLDVVGADRFPSVTTFVERGEIQTTITNGNLANLGRLSLPPSLQQRGRYEYYFKSPNLRFRSIISEKNQVMGLRGCDGKVAWYIDASLKHQEFTPKPGQEFDCERGLEPLPRSLLDANTKFRLAGKKKVEGRIVWEIKAENPKSHFVETYYFDADTYLLFRHGPQGHFVTYSDYREVGGIKKPFTVINEDGNVRVTMTVREVQINVPIDDSRFVEPQTTNGRISLAPVPPVQSGEARAAIASVPMAPEPGGTASATQINYPNFTTCAMTELQTLVPELQKLKPTDDQTELQRLLEKIGAKLLDTARNTPNLISREVVTESDRNIADKPLEYDYLILTRLEGAEISLNEFRVDLKTGEKFQTDYVNPRLSDAAQVTESKRSAPDEKPAASQAGQHPLSHGFASSWVYFLPRNQPQSAFRYLGEQKLDHRRSVAVAFAQKPQAVLTPGLFRHNGKIVPTYFQGVAWFDPSNLRILRIRTELLSPIPEISLQQLSADIQFAETRIASVSSILFLPRDLVVTSVVEGATLREHHSYSDYRLFRAQSKILLNP